MMKLLPTLLIAAGLLSAVLRSGPAGAAASSDYSDSYDYYSDDEYYDYSDEEEDSKIVQQLKQQLEEQAADIERKNTVIKKKNKQIRKLNQKCPRQLTGLRNNLQRQNKLIQSLKTKVGTKKVGSLPLCTSTEKKKFERYCRLAETCAGNGGGDQECQCTACSLRKIYIRTAISKGFFKKMGLNIMRALGIAAGIIDPYVLQRLSHVEELMVPAVRRSTAPLEVGLGGVPERALSKLGSLTSEKCADSAWFHSQCRMGIPAFNDLKEEEVASSQDVVFPERGMEHMLRDFGMDRSPQLLYILDRWDNFDANKDGSLDKTEWTKAKESMSLGGDARKKFLALAAESLPECLKCKERVAREVAAMTYEDMLELNEKERGVLAPFQKRANMIRGKICAARGQRLLGSMGEDVTVGGEEIQMGVGPCGGEKEDVDMKEKQRLEVDAVRELRGFFRDVLSSWEGDILTEKRVRGTLALVDRADEATSRRCALDLAEKVVLDIEKRAAIALLPPSKLNRERKQKPEADMADKTTKWKAHRALISNPIMDPALFFGAGAKARCMPLCETACKALPPPGFSRGACALRSDSSNCASMCKPVCDLLVGSSTAQEGLPVFLKKWQAYDKATKRCNNPDFSISMRHGAGSMKIWPHLPAYMSDCQFRSKARSKLFSSRIIKECNTDGFMCQAAKNFAIAASFIPAETPEQCMKRFGFPVDYLQDLKVECLKVFDKKKCDIFSITTSTGDLELASDDDEEEESTEVPLEDETDGGSFWCGSYEDCATEFRRYELKIKRTLEEKEKEFNGKKVPTSNGIYAVLFHAMRESGSKKDFEDGAYRNYLISKLLKMVKDPMKNFDDRAGKCRATAVARASQVFTVSPAQDTIEGCTQVGRERSVANCLQYGSEKKENKEDTDTCLGARHQGMCDQEEWQEKCAKTCTNHDSCTAEWNNMCFEDEKKTEETINCSSKMSIEYITNCMKKLGGSQADALTCAGEWTKACKSEKHQQRRRLEEKMKSANAMS